MQDIKEKILVIDDDESCVNLTKLFLKSNGYSVITAENGVEGIKKAMKEMPDLIITDINMPLMDGYDLSRTLRGDALLSNTPIIMLTVLRADKAQIKGINCGIDDYLTKPYTEYMLCARVERVLSRTKQNLDANPLTRLPGNRAIVYRIEELIKEKKDFAVFYIDLNAFKTYNDYYGFLKGDEVIKFTAKVIIKAAEKISKNPFIGHIGGDDFVVISEIECVEALANEIISDFDNRIKNYYEKKDLERGHVITKDRQGKESAFHVTSLSIAITTTKNKEYKHLGEINSVLTEIKKYVKELKKSAYIVDKRH